MKKNRLSFYCLVLISLFGAFLLRATDATNTTATIQESWETISNRWGPVPLEKTKQAAENGEVSAQYYLGCAYKDGNGVSKDSVESFKWMNLAALQGLAKAQRNLGWYYEYGMGVETNVSEAIGWFQKAATLGDADAQFHLGWMYDNGVNVAQDYAEAAKFYLLAAEQGHSMAQNNLGWLYKNGWGVPQDEAEALKWFQKSADQGESLGEENLAWIFAHGAYGPKEVTNYGPGALLRSGGVAPNHELAEKWMRKAVDLNTMEGEYKLGNLIYYEMAIRTYEQQENLEQDGTRFPIAAEWLKKAAEQGYAKAQYRLADMYNSGQLGDDQRSNCIPWFLKAAAQGVIEAQAEVGQLPTLYPDNELLKSVNTIEILRQSGEQGNLNAQYQLAKRYQFGIGVPKDPVEAFKWMQKAANNSTASSVIGDAIYCLAVMYEKGEGVTQDVAQAHNLFLEAAGPAFSQQDAAFRVGQMYENGDGVSQDDQKAAGFYANKQIFFPDNDKYPNGVIDYHGVTASSVESLLRLWSQGRGLPSEQEKALPGYKDPGAQVRYWGNSLGTVEAHYFTGEIYYQGKLLPQDLVEAAARFHLAANHHLPDALKALSEVELKMSPEQKAAEKSRLEALEKNFEMIKQTAEAQQQGKEYMPWGPEY